MQKRTLFFSRVLQYNNQSVRCLGLQLDEVLKCRKFKPEAKCKTAQRSLLYRHENMCVGIVNQNKRWYSAKTNLFELRMNGSECNICLLFCFR